MEETTIISQGLYVGGCQNYGPFLDTLNIRCRIIIGIQKGTIILKTTQHSTGLILESSQTPTKDSEFGALLGPMC